MIHNSFQKFASQTIANLATGGALGTAAATVDVCAMFFINQTTAGQIITIPSPTNAIAGNVIHICSGLTATASFVVGGQTISVGEYAKFVWNGTGWIYSGDARNQGAKILVPAITVGNNTITHNLALPTGSFSNIIFDAYDSTGNQVLFRRVFASDTTNTLVLNSTIALTNITFFITPII